MDPPDFSLPGPSRLSPSRSPSPIPFRRKRRIILDSDSECPVAPQPLLVGGGKSRKCPTDPSRRRVTRAQKRRASSPSLTTDLDTIAAEDVSVKAEITRLGVGLRDVQGDGNCLFRALADQLWGVQKRHVEVRKLVCDYLETNRAGMEVFVLAFMREGESYEGYVERMRQLKTFGSHIEIQAAARVFKRNIRVVMSTTSFTIPWETESFASTPNTTPSSPTSHNNEKSRMRTRSSTINLLSTPAAPPPSSPSYATALAEYIPPIRPGRSMLWLALFSQAEHFQSVRRKGDGDSGAAEVEDRLTFPHEKDLSEAARRERGEMPKFIPTERGIDQVLASLPPDHGITPKQAVSVLPHVKGNLGEAVEILLEEIESDSGNDHRVDEMLAFRTTSPAETTTSSSSEQGTGTSQVTTPSAGSAEVEKAKGGLGGDLVEMGKLEVASQPRGRGGVRRGRGRGRGTGGTVRAR